MNSQVPTHDVGRDDAERQDYPSPALYVIATPIGNLADITLRALECLRRVDAIAAEDTRVTRHLLDHFGLDKPTFAAHQHNEQHVAQTIVARLRAGQRIGLVCDAGTPAISDPGARLVAAVQAAGLRVVPIPGVSALTCALSVSGLVEGAFHFAGFVPARPQQAEKLFAELATLRQPLVFYEAPHRVVVSCQIMARVLGGTRKVVIARELTKMFESVHVTTLADASSWLSQDFHRQRGEFVILVDGAADEIDPVERALPTLKRLMQSLSLSEAVDLTAELTGAAKKMLYARALAMRDAT